MLNNKGFAISTMLYGLLIVIILIISLLMSTMSFTRKSSKEFTESIVNELEQNKSFTTNTSIFTQYKDECKLSANTLISTCENNCDIMYNKELRECCTNKCLEGASDCINFCTAP